MVDHDTDDVRPYGGVNLDTLQRYLNFHYSVSLDLFGSEASTNAANYYAAGLKGRFGEESIDDDHVLVEGVDTIEVPSGDGIVTEERQALSLVNQHLRRSYADDCQKGMNRWNRTLAPLGVELRLPHVGFNRRVGVFAGVPVTPAGELVSREAWDRAVDAWLPTDQDRDDIATLMVGVREPGKMAGWIAPPASGINAKPLDYDYVRL